MRGAHIRNSLEEVADSLDIAGVAARGEDGEAAAEALRAVAVLSDASVNEPSKGKVITAGGEGDQ